MNNTSHSFFNNNDSFDFAKDSIDTELGECFVKNSIKATLASSQFFAPGTLKGVITITAGHKLLAGKIKLKLVTNFEMRILRNKRSLELGQILKNIRKQENEADLSNEQKERRRASKQLWAQIRKRSSVARAFNRQTVKQKTIIDKQMLEKRKANEKRLSYNLNPLGYLDSLGKEEEGRE